MTIGRDHRSLELLLSPGALRPGVGPDTAKRQALYSKIQASVNRDCPFLYTVEPDRIFATAPNVKGFVPNSQGKYGFEDVFLSK